MEEAGSRLPVGAGDGRHHPAVGPRGRAARPCGARRGTSTHFAALRDERWPSATLEGDRRMGGVERAEPRRLVPARARSGALRPAARGRGRRDPGSVDPAPPCCPAGSPRRRRTTRGPDAPRRFLDRVYDSGAMDVVDAIAYHPYSFPDLPSQRTGDNGFIDQLRRVREVMVDHGDGDKKVWLTEFGFAHARRATRPARPPGADGDRRLRAVAVARLRRARCSGSTGATPRCGIARTRSVNFGLRRSDDSAKPAFAASGRRCAGEGPWRRRSTSCW